MQIKHQRNQVEHLKQSAEIYQINLSVSENQIEYSEPLFCTYFDQYLDIAFIEEEQMNIFNKLIMLLRTK